MIVIYAKFHAHCTFLLGEISSGKFTPPPGYDGKIPPSTPAFPAFELNTERYGEMRTRITPNTDTFQAVNVKQRALYLEQLLDLTMSRLSQYQS